MSDQILVYEVVGGLPFFEGLVDRFYDGVASDPDLLAVYPQPDDLGPARRRLALFLAEYWGGTAHLQCGARAPPTSQAALRLRDRDDGARPVARAHESRHRRDGPATQTARLLLEYFEMGAEMVRNRD